MQKEILDEIRLLREEIQTLQSQIIPRLERLESHIDFVEHTYDGLRNPIDYIKSYFNTSNTSSITY
jgi:hypothetical protein